MFFKKKKKDEFSLDDDLGDPLKSPSIDDEIKNNEFVKSNEEATNFSNFNASSMSNSPDSLNSLHNNGFSQSNSDQQSMSSSNSNGLTMKEYEIMNSKLDSIKSELDAMAQHILRIEREVEEKKKKPMW